MITREYLLLYVFKTAVVLMSSEQSGVEWSRLHLPKRPRSYNSNASLILLVDGDFEPPK